MYHPRLSVSISNVKVLQGREVNERPNWEPRVWVLWYMFSRGCTTSLTLGGGGRDRYLGGRRRHDIPHLTSNFGFSSDFGHFIFRKAMLTFKKQSFKNFKKRLILEVIIPALRIGGRVPRVPRGAASDVFTLVFRQKCENLPQKHFSSKYLFWSKSGKHNVTLTSLTTDLWEPANFPLVKMCHIDNRECAKYLPMSRLQQREISWKWAKINPPPPVRHGLR